MERTKLSANNKVLFISAVFFFTITSMITKCGCSKKGRIPHAFENISEEDDNTTEVDDGLGKILQDLDRCIEIRAKLNQTDYLTTCLETEISSIIFNVMDPTEEVRETSENKTKPVTNPFEEPNFGHDVPLTKTQVENIQISEIKESLRKQNNGGTAKPSGRGVHQYADFKRNKDEFGGKSRSNKYVLKDIFLHVGGRHLRHLRKRDLYKSPATRKSSIQPVGKRADKNIQQIMDQLKLPLNVNNSKREIASSLFKNDKSELSEDDDLNNTNNNEIGGVLLRANDQHLNEVRDDTMDFKAEIKKLWRENNIKSLKDLLENVKSYLEEMKIDTKSDLKNNTGNQKEPENATDQIATESNVRNEVSNGAIVQKNSKDNIRFRQPKEYNVLEKTTESSLDILMNHFFRWEMISYGLDKMIEYGRSLNDYGAAKILWNILKTGYTIATSGRKKNDHKPQVMSGLILLGVVVPTLFSVVALMAKKALISSLIALALSIYAVTKSKGGHVKQKYEVEGLLDPGTKYSEFKANSGVSANYEFPNVASIPIPNVSNSPYSQLSQSSHTHDDTKYFNRPLKQQESETMVYKNVEPFEYNNIRYRTRKPSQESPVQNNYLHDYSIPNSPETSSYEVTERTDILKHRRPTTHVNDNRYKYVLDQEDNSNAVTEPFRPINYEDSEERYRNSNYHNRPTHEETTRHGKGNDYRGRYTPTRHESRGSSNTPKYNTYKNSDSYRAESNKRFKATSENTEGSDQNVASSERNLKTNKNYSSKFANANIKEDPASNEHIATEFHKYTTEFEPSLSTENLVKQIPRTEVNVYTNQIQSTVATDNDHSEDVFKPIIVTTQAPKYKTSNRQTNQASDKVKNPHQNNDHTKPPNQYFTQEDIILYQNLEEHEFRRPSPVYKPTESESHKETKAELTLSYVPKIKSNSNTTIVQS